MRVIGWDHGKTTFTCEEADSCEKTYIEVIELIILTEQYTLCPHVPVAASNMSITMFAYHLIYLDFCKVTPLEFTYTVPNHLFLHWTFDLCVQFIIFDLPVTIFHSLFLLPFSPSISWFPSTSKWRVTEVTVIQFVCMLNVIVFCATYYLSCFVVGFLSLGITIQEKSWKRGGERRQSYTSPLYLNSVNSEINFFILTCHSHYAKHI